MKKIKLYIKVNEKIILITEKVLTTILTCILGILFNNSVSSSSDNNEIIKKDNISKNWKKYIGTFKDGKPHGSGTLYLKNGNIIQSDSFCSGVITKNAKIYELNRKCKPLDCGNGIFII